MKRLAIITGLLSGFFAVVGVLCVSFCSEASPTTTKVQFFFRLWFVDAYSSIQKLPDRNGKHSEGFVSWLCAGPAYRQAGL